MNHFFFRYQGNKRKEANNFNRVCFTYGIKDIYEIFCGSSALSFSIWLDKGDKHNYYLNDNSKVLIDIYNTFKNEPLEEIEKKVNEIREKINNKDDWVKTFKENNYQDVYLNIFFFKYSNFGRVGFYPNDLRYKKKDYSLSKLQQKFLEFIKSPYVHISCGDWFEIFDKHKDDNEALFIIDPPYMQTCNDFYLEKTLNIYEYFSKLKMEDFKSDIYFILEDTWIIRMLFKNNRILTSYDKRYEVSNKKTSHIIINNKLPITLYTQ